MLRLEPFASLYRNLIENIPRLCKITSETVRERNKYSLGHFSRQPQFSLLFRRPRVRADIPGHNGPQFSYLLGKVGYSYSN